MKKNSWQEIAELIRAFNKLGISQSIDYEKFYLYSLITHSTAIEGSTLTEMETQLLFDEGITAKGKPLIYHLMNQDLKKAYEFALAEAKQKTPLTPNLLQTINATLMRTTGSLHSTLGGSFDSSKGEFRLCGVTAGAGGRSYMNYQKVPAQVEAFCLAVNEKLSAAVSLQEQYELSFNAHLNLVTIHPWVDGNGRASRLLMNYLQFCYGLFPSKIFKEERADYILSLQQSQDEESNTAFLNFMTAQLKKSLLLEIERHDNSHKKGFQLMF
jgi:Fic family protein